MRDITIIWQLFKCINLNNHNLIIVTTKEKRIDYKNRPYTRIYSGKNIAKFQTSLAHTDYSKIYSSNDINDSVDYLTNSISNLSDSAFPLVRCSRKNFKHKSWINEELKSKIIQK